MNTCRKVEIILSFNIQNIIISCQLDVASMKESMLEAHPVTIVKSLITFKKFSLKIVSEDCQRWSGLEKRDISGKDLKILLPRRDPRKVLKS